MSAIGFPYFPISHMVERCLGTEKFEADLRTTIRWSKIPTQHDFAIYNGTAVIANVSLLATVAIVVAVVVSCLHPVWGLVAFSVSLWTHVSAGIDCTALSQKIQGILAEVDPVMGHLWQGEIGECLFLSWHDIVLPSPQSGLDELPSSFDLLRPKIKMRDRELFTEIKGAWLEVHERNRPYLREFFNEQVVDYEGDNQGKFLYTLCETCLLEEGARKYFAEPRTRAEMSTFFEQTSDNESSGWSSGSEEDI